MIVSLSLSIAIRVSSSEGLHGENRTRQRKHLNGHTEGPSGRETTLIDELFDNSMVVSGETCAGGSIHCTDDGDP